MFTTIDVTSTCKTAEAGYNQLVPDEFTIGDVIRKARGLRHWNQTRLGKEAAKYGLHSDSKSIDKSTVSKVERDPYSSEFGTVWRLIAAVGLTLADVERRVTAPFVNIAEMESMAKEAEREIKSGMRKARK